MQGIWINGVRPRSKKSIKEAAKERPASIGIEAISVFGNEYDGPATALPLGTKVYFAGPDPFIDRRFYGTVERLSDGTIKVS